MGQTDPTNELPLRRHLFLLILSVTILLSSPVSFIKMPAYGDETNILVKQYEFIPNSIEVKRGVPVSLVFTSEYITQSIIIYAFKITEVVEKGVGTTISFTPDRVGVFEYFATAFPGFGHKGLRGKLIVTD
jgi:heme/copper-type cytochrome/quinol oxidase subunit 2